MQTDLHNSYFTVRFKRATNAERKLWVGHGGTGAMAGARVAGATRGSAWGG